MPKELDEYVTVNPDRFKMIVQAIVTVTEDEKPVTLGALRAALPDDFGLDPKLDHLQEILDNEHGTAATMAATESGDGAVDDADKAPEAVLAHVRELDEKCHGLRGQIATLTTQRQRTRANLSEAIVAYQKQTGPRITALDNTRDYLKSANAERAAQAAHGREPIPTPGKSAVDRAALYSGHSASGSDGTAFVAKMMTTGFRRGSTPASRKGAATRRKVPQ